MIILTPSTPQTTFINQQFTAEYDYNHYLDRYYIYWDLSTQCNFKCSYCYARAEYKDDWNKIDSYSRQLLVLKALSFSDKPIFLGFHGGEPTVHPRFIDLITESLKVLNHKDSRLYIVTNGSTSVFDDIPINKKIYLLWSCHMEFKQKYGKNYEKFLKNIQLMKEKGFKNKVNLLLIPNKRYWNDIHYLYSKLKELDVIIHPHFIYTVNGSKEIIWDYPKEFFDEFKELNFVQCKYIFENDSEHVELTDYELFKNDLCHFKGWLCYNNNFEIKYNGLLRRICTNHFIDLTKDIFFFKRYKFTPMKCTSDNCLSDGVLKCLKIRDSSNINKDKDLFI